ncbi:DUF87 domain-containing protein [Candidatus Poribacteria bacterium]|nr:DUF87 domain-containing protein [Candidatus Poribacteria bacterium]
MKLFTRDSAVGVFRGFSEGGLEFHADLVLPYRNEFQSAPMHGQFLVVQLENEDEAVLGRITSISAQGRLASSAGEDYGIRAVAEDRQMPEDLREQYLKYRVNMRVLGVLRIVDDKTVFAASHRRLTHVGSKVGFLPKDLLQEVAGHNENGAELGYFALGEFIYTGDDSNLKPESWMQLRSPRIVSRFPVENLVARRSFVFARAGFCKSNLVKLLFSNLYAKPVAVEKRGGRKVPVGTIIFDPDGEYFWPDDKNRPGLCDVPALEDKVVVFTSRTGPSPFYQSFVAGNIRLDIRRLRPADVISIALSPEKQDQQNVRKLKGLNDTAWRRLVDEIYQNGNTADEHLIQQLLNLNQDQQAETIAARANMTTIVRMLHDPSSQMMDMLIAALREGRICVVDVSQMRGTPALVLSGLILSRIFDHNQEEFTKAQPETIPVIAVVEEAQTVLGGSGSSGEGPYISWVKEGRKYDLGAMLITQQPGSISSEILSQGDNWFIFHLLSAGDLAAVKRANAHFSDDLLSSLLNEPIPGHGVFWSSVSGKSYPIPIRVLSFEALYQAHDSQYSKPAAKTSAVALEQRFTQALTTSRLASSSGQLPTKLSDEKPGAVSQDVSDDTISVETQSESPEDVLETYVCSAIQHLSSEKSYIGKLRSQGAPWRDVLEKLKEGLPDVIEDSERNNLAHQSVARAMEEIFGRGKWRTEKRPSKSGGGTTTWIVVQ